MTNVPKAKTRSFLANIRSNHNIVLVAAIPPNIASTEH